MLAFNIVMLETCGNTMIIKRDDTAPRSLLYDMMLNEVGDRVRQATLCDLGDEPLVLGNAQSLLSKMLLSDAFPHNCHVQLLAHLCESGDATACKVVIALAERLLQADDEAFNCLLRHFCAQAHLKLGNGKIYRYRMFC